MFTQDEFGHFGPVSGAPSARPFHEIQYLDVKELNDSAAEQRAEIKALLDQHRKFTSREQGVSLRQEIYLRWERYRFTLTEAREMTEQYMLQIKNQNFRASSPTQQKKMRAAA